MMVNNRKNMSYYIMWVPKDEEKIVRKILGKSIKTKEELALLGDIFSRINSNEDFKLG